jgi:serine/threonine-protein kinase
LTDFGIAWVFAGEHLTVTGAVVGTAEYLSPEQAAGKSPTKKSDLYSLGAVLYTLVTGQTPFEGEVVDLLHKHRYAQFDRPSRLVPELPHDLEAVICELLEKEPEKRPPDAGVLHRRLDSLRRKYERRAAQLTQTGDTDTALAGGQRRRSRQGPATMVAGLVREELDQQKHGGPLQRFFNHPAVLLALFLVTVGVIVWGFLPPSPEKLYERGAALMRSEDPADWETAWDKYLSKLQERYPDFRTEEVEAFRRKAEAARESRRESARARLAGPMSEAHWFFEKGLRLRQQGREEEAKKVWRELITAFDRVLDEEPWVRRARQELSETPNRPYRKGEERWASVRKVLQEARQLEKQGKADEAKKLRQALRDLYADEPSARAILDEDAAKGEKRE